MTIKDNDWSNKTNSIDEYIDAEYYDSIIKDYVFDGVTDLELFEKFLTKPKYNSVLELGSGSGRSTRVFLNNAQYSTLDLVDLSHQMLDTTQKKFKDHGNINFHQSDHISFLEDENKKSTTTYDLVFSLWSFSHSVHANLHKLGLQRGRKYLYQVLEEFIINKISTSGELFLIHFDSLSDEQKILMRQWKRVYPVYHDTSQQSPSKLIIDELLRDLRMKNKITFESTHHTGEPIHYTNTSELLEVFMNFHMETFFNKQELFNEVKQSVVSMSEEFKNPDDSYDITPGCFLYKVKRI